MASRSPVLKNLLVVGGSLLASGLAAQLALETRLLVSPYEVGGEGCVRFHRHRARATVQDSAASGSRQPKADSQHRRMPPAAEQPFIRTATGEMRTHGTEAWNASSP